MRLLKRLVDVADPRFGIDRLRQADVPELSRNFIRWIGRPELEDHIERFFDHLGRILRIGPIEFLIGGNAARPETEIEPALGKMVEKRQPTGDVRGMVLV